MSVPGIAAQFTFTIGRESARAQLVNGRGNALLARAGFAKQQHRRSGRSHLADQLKGAPEGGTRPHDLRGIAPLPDFVAQVHVVVLQLVPESFDVPERGLELSFRFRPGERFREDLRHEFKPRHKCPGPPPGCTGRGEREAPEDRAVGLERHGDGRARLKAAECREVGGGFRGQIVEGRNRDGFARQDAPGHPGEVVRRRGVLRNRIACREELARRSAHDAAVERH